MLLVSTSLVLNVIVVTVFSRSNSGEPVPIWLRTLTIHILAPMVRVKPGDIAKSAMASRKKQKGKNKPGGFGWVRSSREIEFERVPNGVRQSGLTFDTADAEDAEKNAMDYGSQNMGVNQMGLESIAMELRKVNNILASVGHTNPQAGPPKSPEEKQNDKAWVVTARVLDRVFLVLYLIGNVLSLMMLIFQILHIGEPVIDAESLCKDGSGDDPPANATANTTVNGTGHH